MLEYNQEILEKVKEATSVEELIQLAKEHNIEATDHEVAKYFSMMNPKAGELEDEELDNVVGGACYTKNNELIITAFNTCKYFREDAYFNKGSSRNCGNCHYVNRHSMPNICTNSLRRRG